MSESRFWRTHPDNEVIIVEANRIIREVAEKHKLTEFQLKGPQRAKYLILPRYEAMWRISKETGASLTQIGRRFERDHSSVLYGIRRYEAKLKAEQNA